MAVRADFHAKHVALDGRTSLQRVAAGTVHRDGMIVGMNTRFHEASFRRVRSARRSVLRRGASPLEVRGTAASLGRGAILNHMRSVKFLKLCSLYVAIY